MSEAQMKGAMKTLRNMCMPKSGVSKGIYFLINFILINLLILKQMDQFKSY